MFASRCLVSFACLFATTHVASAASKESAQLGRKMWAAFECGTFAELAGKQVEQQRLFEVALQSGRGFVEAVRKGNVSDEDIRTNVPIGVTLRLRGPSTDFIIGRVFEGAVEHAYEKVTIVNRLRPKTDPDNQISDERLKKTRADSEYTNSNCELIR